MINKILNVYKTLGPERQRKLFRAIDHLAQHLVVYVEGRINGYRVARVHPCPFDMFHYSGNKAVLAVGNYIDLQLLTH